VRRGHRAMPLPFTWTNMPAPRKGSRSDPAGGKAGCTDRRVRRNLAARIPCLAGWCVRAQRYGKTLPRKTSLPGFRSNSNRSFPVDEVKALREAARDLKITIVIGVNERVDSGPGSGDTLPIRFSLFQKMDSSETTIGSSSRPTRNALVWGNGDGPRVGSSGLLPPGAWVD